MKTKTFYKTSNCKDQDVKGKIANDNIKNGRGVTLQGSLLRELEWQVTNEWQASGDVKVWLIDLIKVMQRGRLLTHLALMAGRMAVRFFWMIML